MAVAGYCLVHVIRAVVETPQAAEATRVLSQVPVERYFDQVLRRLERKRPNPRNGRRPRTSATLSGKNPTVAMCE